MADFRSDVEFCYLTGMVWLLIAAIMSQIVSPSACRAENKSTTADQRTIQFDKKHSMGALYLVPKSDRGYIGTTHAFSAALNKVQVTVPADRELAFEPNTALINHPQDFQTLPSSGIDAIRIVAFAVEEDQSICDKILAFVAHLTGLKRLTVEKTDVTDAGLSKMKDMTNLQTIAASYSNIDGDCFKDLTKLKKLEDLDVSFDRIKTENLKYLAQFPNLKYLWLYHTGITDEGCKYIAQCPNLATVNLRSNPKITDQGLKRLAELKNLEILDLRDSPVTFNGISQLKSLKKLKFVNLKQSCCTAREWNQIKHDLPHTQFALGTNAPGDVDKLTKRIFAPLK